VRKGRREDRLASRVEAVDDALIAMHDRSIRGAASILRPSEVT
jgi:hypothetical protein